MSLLNARVGDLPDQRVPNRHQSFLAVRNICERSRNTMLGQPVFLNRIINAQIGPSDGQTKKKFNPVGRKRTGLLICNSRAKIGSSVAMFRPPRTARRISSSSSGPKTLLLRLDLVHQLHPVMDGSRRVRSRMRCGCGPESLLSVRGVCLVAAHDLNEISSAAALTVRSSRRRKNPRLGAHGLR